MKYTPNPYQFNRCYNCGEPYFEHVITMLGAICDKRNLSKFKAEEHMPYIEAGFFTVIQSKMIIKKKDLKGP